MRTQVNTKNPEQKINKAGNINEIYTYVKTQHIFFLHYFPSLSIRSKTTTLSLKEEDPCPSYLRLEDLTQIPATLTADLPLNTQ